jgi:hypothetical protein
MWIHKLRCVTVEWLLHEVATTLFHEFDTQVECSRSGSVNGMYSPDVYGIEPIQATVPKTFFIGGKNS